MIPIKDDIPSGTVPFVNYAILALTSLFFVLQLAEPKDQPSLIERYGMIPARLANPDQPVPVVDERLVQTPYGIERVRFKRPAAEPGVPILLTLLTCIFLHGGWMHFIGNMWFLWIFGDNVEDRLGHGKYLLFYLISGIAASAAHLVTNWGSPIPTIGASGAIAGVMGAYLLLYPHARVITIVPIFFFLQVLVVPAALFLGIWFLIQFFQGAFSIASVASSGVAWWAHIGGFAFGLLVAWRLGRSGALRPPVDIRRPRMDRFTTHRRRW